MAVAQVGDAGAAQLADAGQRAAVGCAAQDHIDPVAGTLQRGSVVRCTQKDDIFQIPGPLQSRQAGIVHGTARDQTAHAVRQHADLAHRQRPVLQQWFKLCGQRLAILRDVQAAVVAQIDRGKALLLRQRGGVIDGLAVLLAAPLQIIHAQAMDDQKYLRADVGQINRALGVDDPTLMAQGHGRGQRIGTGLQLLAHDTIEGSDGSGTLKRLRTGTLQTQQQRLKPGKRRRQALTHQGRDPRDALIDRTGQTARLARHRTTGGTQSTPDRLVHPFGHAGDCPRGLGGQQRQGAQVAGAPMVADGF
ncbi:hypothetical protein GALL_511670 [mine drainage metagenome]|uniref:Uncharacterized protein n=1 Tax=mine drainage metagenome TaxID=410659 RepID=A0A1J5P6Q6_9ZZZZ